ncbi:MAG: DUF3783 domain-containing protein [Lachnospiraceae bacterium]
MAMAKETVLYYHPGKAPHIGKLKGVLVQMGVRIKNITPEQTGELVGYLAGIPGFEPQAEGTPAGDMIPEEMLVMKNFSSGRMDQLLMGLRKAGVPKINLKAVITEQNSKWTFYQLYQELKEEHESFQNQK